MWLKITGAGYLLEDHPDYYKNIKQLSSSVDTRSIKQIEKDVNRTFPGDRTFDKQELRNVLVAYSIRNPNVGYCQGLNFVVATILSLEFSEEESFWIYVQIIEKYLPFEYFTSMSGVILDQKIFDFLFRSKLQKICKHIESLGVESSLFTVQWFICLYSFTFSKQFTAQIWDLIFLKGPNVIFQIGLAALWILRKDILSKKDFVQILDGIECGCRNMTDFNLLQNTILSRKFRIKSVLINKLKELLEKEVISEYMERFSNLIEPDVLIKTISTACKDDNECRQKVLCTSGYFTFSLCEITVIDDFVENGSYPKILNTSYLRDNEEIYMIGKRNHCCLFDKDLDDFSDDESQDISFRTRNNSVSVKKSFAQISSQVNSRDYY
jgi:Rab-GTPase-TBC domain